MAEFAQGADEGADLGVHLAAVAGIGAVAQGQRLADRFAYGASDTEFLVVVELAGRVHGGFYAATPISRFSARRTRFEKSISLMSCFSAAS